MMAHRPTRATHTVRACERCRSRKQRCSGEAPYCQNCSRANVPCRYTEAVDRRKLAIAWKQENQQLRSRVTELEQQVRRSGTAWGSATSSPLPSTSALDDDSDEDQNDSDMDPFGVGELVLSPDGKLHLGEGATFYRSGGFLSSSAATSAASRDQQHLSMNMALSSRSGEPPPSRRMSVHAPFEAPYLPHPLTPSEHQRLLDLFFQSTPTFGMNSFKEQFLLSMRTSPLQKAFYFSPLLHLVCLGIGSRYDVQRQGRSDDYESRGQAFIGEARKMIDVETEQPVLATILALMFLSIYHFGMSNDQAATNYYAIGVFLVQEFRLHRRCDEQLRSLGLEPNDELDIARRDVYGFVYVFGSWWMNYVARMSLDFSSEANQRQPFLRSTVLPAHQSDPTIPVVTLAFKYHCQISQIGQQIVFCNHSWRTKMRRRVEHAKRLAGDLRRWRQDLPDQIQWPQRNASQIMLPGVATLLAMYNAYVIELHRPYISSSASNPEIWPGALEVCLKATSEMVDIIRFIREVHGVYSAHLTNQQAIYVSGTMLILRASGMGDPSAEEIDESRRCLLYVLTWLDEFSEVWPAAGQTADVLRKLQMEHCI